MTLASTDDLVADAVANRTGVAAFNVITLEHAEAIVAGAQAVRRPVILQISENAVLFHGGQLGPIAVAARKIATHAEYPVALHLDHVTDSDLLHEAAAAGFSSAMFDAGALPYQENVAATRAAADWAHSSGLWLEGELGYVGGKPDAPASAHAAGVRTDPAEAAAYVEATGVDALAVAVGSSHAMTTRNAQVDHELIARLATVVQIPLVLHGSSGIADADLSGAVQAGIRKVNVGTALNIAFTAALRAKLATDRGLVDPRTYLSAARTAMAEVVSDLLNVISP
ncbi:MAG TPA: class II fructose-bisphosphate aldolase [Jatrophihabitans sp.]|jgi:fructose-bisphosphate aldolase class II